MSFFFPEVEKKYVYKRKGTQDDPYVPISESLKVVNSRVILKEVPDLFTKVTVKDSNGNFLYETTSLTPNANEYRVDYSLGIVYFNSSNEGKEFTFDYRGVGLVAFPASRIWTRESNGEIAETLQELIDTITITVNEIKQEQSHLADYVKHPAFAVTTGSANAYEVTLNPAPIAYEDDEIPQHKDLQIITEEEYLQIKSEIEANRPLTPEVEKLWQRIELMQQALDDLLLELGGMEAYLAQRIIDRACTYDYVTSKRPDLEEGIDAYLIEKGREDLITQ